MLSDAILIKAIKVVQILLLTQFSQFNVITAI